MLWPVMYSTEAARGEVEFGKILGCRLGCRIEGFAWMRSFNSKDNVGTVGLMKLKKKREDRHISQGSDEE